jgi:hypothetical protein
MEIKELQRLAYENAQAKGFTDTTFPDWISNLHSEVSEAWEEYRAGKPLDVNMQQWTLPADFPYTVELTDDGYRVISPILGEPHHMDEEQFKNLLRANKIPLKPIGIPSEVADIVIRAADMAERCGFDLQAAIAEKMEYNRLRAYRHGGKLA